MLKDISIYNPWYQNPNFLFPEKKFKKRRQFFLLNESLKKQLILSLIGLRRTGKSTIIKQIINELLSQINPENILFYEFDEKDINLEEILQFYFKNILKQDLYSAKCFIFLDELQFILGWQIILKKYFDINPNIQFIISGSTHLYLHKDTKESLAGRIINIHLHPLSWYEFLELKHKKKYYLSENIFQDNFFENAKKNQDILLYKEDLKTFLSFGEYPYFFHENNSIIMEKYYKEAILEKIFSKDINLFNVDMHKKFFNLFKVLNKDSAQEINIANIARELEINTTTIKKYINILDKMFLYSTISKHTNLRAQIKSFKKGYVTSLNLLRATLGLDYWDIDNKQFGHIIETFVYNELVKNNTSFYEINFYHDSKIKKEVDFVLNKGQKIIPIEVKTTTNLLPKHLKNIQFFMEKYKLSRGYIFYGGDELIEEKISCGSVFYIPYFMI